MERIVKDLGELEQEAARFAAELAPHTDSATLIALAGELGAGKTAFTQALARSFEVTDPVTSPTFVLEKEYALKDAPFTRLVHIDAYRLEGDTSLTPLAFAELMEDPGALVVLEWPERVAEQLPAPAHRITIEAEDDGSRRITYGR